MADLDVVVVGAGFAGIYAVHALRSSGLTVRAFEAGGGIGGTWFWNSYPGARCDVESKDYSFSFSPELEQEWSWSERYPAQPEILRYLSHVADRFGLWPHIQLNTRVTAARWDDDAAQWTVTTDDGAVVSARFFVSAVGCLSAYQVPSLPGLETFSGSWHHTARWPAEGVDFAGKRVGLIGTGSTGIQVAPEIAAVASQLYVFQRTPNYAVPNRNRPWEPEAEREFKSRYREYRKEARESFLGVPITGTGRPVLAEPPEDVQRTFTERWQAGGGMPFLGAYTDLLVSTGRQRRHRRVHAGPDQGDGRRPGGRGAALPADVPGRVEAAVPERRLLRDVQPAQRDAGGPALDAAGVGFRGRAVDHGRVL